MVRDEFFIKFTKIQIETVMLFWVIFLKLLLDTAPDKISWWA